LGLGDLGLTMRQTWRTTSIGLVEAADLVERVLPSISWQTTMWGPWRLPAGKKCPSRNIQAQGMIWLLKCTHSDACARVFQSSYDWDILGHSWTFYHIWTSGVNFTFMFQLVSFPTFPDAIITITRHMFRHFRVRLGIWKMGTTEATTGRVQPQQGNRVGMGPGNHCIEHHKTTARPRMSNSHKCSMDLCNFISFYDQVSNFPNGCALPAATIVHVCQDSTRLTILNYTLYIDQLIEGPLRPKHGNSLEEVKVGRDVDGHLHWKKHLDG
jgi:hypothetical protein